MINLSLAKLLNTEIFGSIESLNILFTYIYESEMLMQWMTEALYGAVLIVAKMRKLLTLGLSSELAILQSMRPPKSHAARKQGECKGLQIWF